MNQQNITLPIGLRGYMLSIAQGVGSGSLKDYQIEVALIAGDSGEFVNSGRWYVIGATSEQLDDHFYDDVVSHIGIEDLPHVIKKATEYVMERDYDEYFIFKK